MNRRTFIKLTGLGYFLLNETPFYELTPQKQEIICETNNLNIKNLAPGEVGIVLGESCSGKSTLLKKIVKEKYHTCGGNYFYFESDVASSSSKKEPISSSNFIHINDFYDFETLLEKMRECSKNACLLICDSLGNYPSQKISLKTNRILEIKKVAIECNVPIIISITTSKMPKINGYITNTSNDYSPMRLADEMVVCRRIKSNHLLSIKIDVLKSRRYS